MLKISQFEIEADDPERASKFYRDVFGWEISKWDGPIDYWLISQGPKDDPGIKGGIYKREIPLTGEGISSFISIIEVPSIDEYMEKAK